MSKGVDRDGDYDNDDKNDDDGDGHIDLENSDEWGVIVKAIDQSRLI